jgi:hypothetical protein
MSKLINDIGNFTSTLNSEGIGKQVLETSTNLLGDLQKYGLEERTISAVVESIFWKLVEGSAACNKFNIRHKLPQHRTFYDGLLNDQPMDFKATRGKTQDNLSAQGAILYCVSGNITFAETKKRLNYQYLTRFKDAAAHAIQNEIDADFAYVILNKDTGLCGYATLKTMKHIVVNQSNFMQATWENNIDHPISRTTDEFVKWITPHLLKFKGYKTK